MITQIQKNILYSLIGSGSVFVDSLFDKKFDIGLKTLFLERALIEDQATFLNSLDRLNTILTAAKHPKKLIILFGLKLINDFFHNNKVDYDDLYLDSDLGESTSGTALSHHFGPGADQHHAGFQDIVRSIVRSYLGEISANMYKEIILRQKSIYLAKELIIEPSARWRTSEAPEELVLNAMTSRKFYNMFEPKSQYQPLYNQLKRQQSPIKLNTPTEVSATESSGIISISRADMISVLKSMAYPVSQSDNKNKAKISLVRNPS